ncbi:SPOR domain-containing protein [Algoriphagus sp. CAU 1675]|uniref:SPOR domain-containing protein n=1 Tax=Algoriphagus sp. CAU 1675 TaxID=3032597 RepID=UPI0023DA5F0C|nr:SPOR domain-containing protein [Algoriphagus sp. CAU 1675]MDF2157704.1 SPOR domain-containing protein [Algoriphagus sp. CAU 1675]
MAENSPKEKSWTDPKDFGLPFVEVKPLKEPEESLEKAEPVEKSVSDTEPSKEVAAPVEAPEIQVESSSLEQEEPKVEAISEHQEEPIVQVQESDDLPEEESAAVEEELVSEEPQMAVSPKKSKTWIIYVMIFGLLLASALVWQFMQEENPSVSEAEKEEPISQVGSSTESEEVLENAQSEEIQSVENQGDILISDSLPSESTEIPETGTTIEHKEDRTLIRVENRGASPQFFIVAASLPNERIATRESAQYFDKVENVYLILPYEGVENYRLAIGAFSSFTQAKAELDRIKADYSEALWILKY